LILAATLTTALAGGADIDVDNVIAVVVAPIADLHRHRIDVAVGVIAIGRSIAAEAITIGVAVDGCADAPDAGRPLGASIRLFADTRDRLLATDDQAAGGEREEGCREGNVM